MFMKPEITDETQWMEIDDEHGETHFVKMEDFVLDDWFHGGEVTLRGRVGFGARLSAAGYLDCTDWCVNESRADAATYLLEVYFDELGDEVDDEERGILRELEELAGQVK